MSANEYMTEVPAEPGTIDLYRKVSLLVREDEGTLRREELTPAERVRLMAAAPDLYEACLIAVEYLERMKAGQATISVLRDALESAYPQIED